MARTFIELDIYLSFDVHTDATLHEIECLLGEYEKRLLVCYTSRNKSDDSQHLVNIAF